MTSSERADRYPRIQLRIGDRWISRPGQLIIDPATEQSLGEVPFATASDRDDAVAAAKAGFETWRRVSPAERCSIMLRGSALIRERIEAIATSITLDQGKPIAQSRLEVLRGCEMLEWDAEQGRRLFGRIIPSQSGMRHSALRQPVGVVAAFSPWNFPMSSPARKIGGALAAGCSLILKPPEETPGAAFLMVQAFVDAGLPPGVLNLIYGHPAEISEQLIAHPDVRMIALTGSTAVGKRVAALAGQHMKPVLMELGGHAPVVVCEDADPEAVAALSVAGKNRNAGQVCVSPTRFFVHRPLFERFATAFANAAASLKVGDGLDTASDMGPLASKRRVDAMTTLVNDAVSKGARLICGGAPASGPGYYFPLTAIADVPDTALVMTTEPFGPLAVINPVDSLEEAIARSNAVPFGLAGYAFTDSARKADRLAEALEVGNLSINHFVASVAETPFGGVKDSGYGREGGVEGVEGYTVLKTVSHWSASE